jgi:putative photosynthetic complex assembly protein
MSDRQPAILFSTLIGLSLAFVLAVSQGWVGAGAAVSNERVVADPIAYRLLTFADRGDGSVEVIDATLNRSLSVIHAGEGAFLRGVLRALTAERRTGGHGMSQPFELRKEAADRLILIDKATGREILLNAFGSENVAFFDQFLSAEPLLS